MTDPDDAAARLDRAVDVGVRTLASLSSLTSPLALEYLERLRQPMPKLTLEGGVELVSRGYVAHEAVEAQPNRFGAASAPEPGGFPALRRGSPPRDVLVRVVKASRRRFPRIRAVPVEVWDGFVSLTVQRAPDDVLNAGAVEGLLRFGWALRHLDWQYGLEPDRH